MINVSKGNIVTYPTMYVISEVNIAHVEISHQREGYERNKWKKNLEREWERKGKRGSTKWIDGWMNEWKSNGRVANALVRKGAISLFIIKKINPFFAFIFLRLCVVFSSKVKWYWFIFSFLLTDTFENSFYFFFSKRIYWIYDFSFQMSVCWFQIYSVGKKFWTVFLFKYRDRDLDMILDSTNPISYRFSETIQYCIDMYFVISLHPTHNRSPVTYFKCWIRYIITIIK